MLSRFVAILSWLSFFALIWLNLFSVLPYQTLFVCIFFAATGLIAGLNIGVARRVQVKRDDD